jgi:hypothetical protein
MTIKRWLPTFLAFPLGGLLAVGTVGSLDDPVTAGAGGLLAGAVIGAAQWLALRPAGIGRRWIGYTAGAMAAGTAVAAAITGAGTELGDLMLSGLVAGAAVGTAQGGLLAATRDALPTARGASGLIAAGWAAVTAASWSTAWLVSWTVIGVNADQGFYVFGSSGALVATAITGLALRGLRAAPRALAA